MTIEIVNCPFCGHGMKVDIPEPQEYTTFEIDVNCGNCGNKVIIPILPKFDARAIESFNLKDWQ